jgi:murein L,D-transpeptidase YafK
MLKKALIILSAIIAAAIFLNHLFYPQISSAAINKANKVVQADKVVVIKSKRAMFLLSNGEILRTYRVALGQNPKGHKIQYGDKRTPEGRYYLDAKNSNSEFHLAIRISYPNESDIKNARRLGVPPGCCIMIHGLPQDKAMLGILHRYRDWTRGCIAVTNSEMEEIWQLIEVGTPIKIKP